jgi:SAM-dependent methyltransferase
MITNRAPKTPVITDPETGGRRLFAEAEDVADFKSHRASVGIMAERTTGLRSLLSHPRAYSLFQSLIGSAAGAERFVSEQVRPQVGMRVLDIGCGPGRLLNLLPEVEYVGFDPSADYISAARETFGDRGRFVVGTTESLADAELGIFDLAVARGVMHHIDDAQVIDLASFARRHLAPAGRLVTLDPALVDHQRRVSRWLVTRDRGQNVRSARSYAVLVQREFGSVAVTHYRDLLRVPYDHASLEATVEAAA